MKKLLVTLILVSLCFAVVALPGCGSSASLGSDYPMETKIVGTWEQQDSDGGYVFNSDGTGEHFAFGALTYYVSYEESSIGSSSDAEEYCWILYIRYGDSPLGQILRILNISDSTLNLTDDSGTALNFTKK